MTRAEDDQLDLGFRQREFQFCDRGILRGNGERAGRAGPGIPQFHLAGGTEGNFGVFRRTIDGVEIAWTKFAVLNVAGPVVVALRQGGQGFLQDIGHRAVGKQFLHHRGHFRVVAAHAVARFGKGVNRQHDSARPAEFQRLLECGMPDRPHGGEDQNPVGLARHVQFLPNHFRARQGLKIHEVEVHGLFVKRSPGGEGGLHRLLATQPGLHRRHWIKDGNITAVPSLTQEITQTLHTVHEPAHMLPVRHAEGIVRRCPCRGHS